MLRAHLSLLVLLALAACKGDRQAPLVAGTGIQIHDEKTKRIIEVDLATVPVVDPTCPEGHAVVRGPNNTWTCPELDAVDRARFLAAEQAAKDATETSTTLTTNLRDIRRLLDDANAVLTAAHPPALAVSAFGCRPREDAIASGRVVTRAGRTGYEMTASIEDIVILCPVFAQRSNVDWNTLEVFYQDPDGPGPGALVSAALFKSIPDGTTQQIAAADSSTPATVDWTTMTAAVTEPFDFDAAVYHVEVVLHRTASTFFPLLGGYRLAHR